MQIPVQRFTVHKHVALTIGRGTTTESTSLSQSVKSAAMVHEAVGFDADQ